MPISSGAEGARIGAALAQIVQLVAGPQGAEERDGLVVSGRLEIEEGARLVVHFGNGYAPRGGDTLSFISTGEGMAGAFSEVSLTGLAPGFEYELISTDGVLTMTALNDAQPENPGTTAPRFAPLPEISAEGIRISIEAQADQEVMIFSSADFLEMGVPVHTNRGSFLFIDTLEPGESRRFYRAIGR